jgi:hypothetical protein
MKPGAHLINAARGTVVDIDALAAPCERGHLAGAAIDVFPVEPKGNDEEFSRRCVGMDNVILTPHIGGSTLEAQDNIGIEVAEQAGPLQRQRLDPDGGELPGSHAARTRRQPSPAAHPPQRARRAVADQRTVLARERHQHRRTVPADRSDDRLRGHRRRRRAGQRVSTGTLRTRVLY